jgi:hypothetical protein
MITVARLTTIPFGDSLSRGMKEIRVRLVVFEEKGYIF